MTKLRTMIFYAAMYSSGLLMSVICLTLYKPFPGIILPAGKIWCQFCLDALRFTCGIKVELAGTESLRATPYILAAQHQSALDILVLMAKLDSPAFIFKQELKSIPLFGRLLEPGGMIPVDRAGGAASLRKMVTAVQNTLAAGRCVIIFPEGTRVAPGEVTILHPGIAALGAACSAPIIPASTNSGKFWGASAFTKTAGTVRFEFFPALRPKMPRKELLEALAKRFYS